MGHKAKPSEEVTGYATVIFSLKFFFAINQSRKTTRE